MLPFFVWPALKHQETQKPKQKGTFVSENIKSTFYPFKLLVKLKGTLTQI